MPVDKERSDCNVLCRIGRHFVRCSEVGKVGKQRADKIDRFTVNLHRCGLSQTDIHPTVGNRRTMTNHFSMASSSRLGPKDAAKSATG